MQSGSRHSRQDSGFAYAAVISAFITNIETLANSFAGVEQSFAIQAGREIRVIVKPEQVDDKATVFLAKEIAQKLEAELEYPGQIKVNVIRETRSVEYAK